MYNMASLTLYFSQLVGATTDGGVTYTFNTYPGNTFVCSNTSQPPFEYICTNSTLEPIQPGEFVPQDFNNFVTNYLVRAVIPLTVTNIGDGAFGQCGRLNSVLFEGNQRDFPSQSDVLIPTLTFNGGLFTNTRLTHIYLPNRLTNIGINTFQNCGFLAEVVFSANPLFTTIPSGTCENCTRLNVLQIDSNVLTFTNAFTNTPFLNDLLADLYTNTNTSSAYTFFSTPQYENVLIIIGASCFNEGTKILVLNKNLNEEYISIQNLQKGDLVKTYLHGYRKISNIGKGKMRNDQNKLHQCMYKLEKTEINGLLEDLIITGGHSILVDDLKNYKEENDISFGGITPKIDDKYLLLSSVSSEFIKLKDANIYTYYHLILENNGNDDERFGIWANGMLTETPSKNQFSQHDYTLV